MNEELDTLSVTEQAMALRDMFLSRGWIQVFKPRLAQMQQTMLKDDIMSASTFEEFSAIREKLFLLEAILDVEPQTIRLVKSLQDNPAEATNVVESE